MLNSGGSYFNQDYQQRHDVMDERRKSPQSIGEKKTANDNGNDSGEKSSPNPPLKGLCINCENRDNCVLPRPAEGVWHCEEYL